jgi:UDP-N-acetyl-D-glucosamine dehydrogenase
MSLDTELFPPLTLKATPRPVQPPLVTFDFDVAIVGLGYVGLPTALALHTAGTRVLGLDVSERRLAAIQNGEADLLESDRERLTTALLDRDFRITSDRRLLRDAAAVVICVPTPIDEYQTPDLGILAAACAMVVESAVVGQLIMLTSTTYAGCTRDMLVIPLEKRGLTVGRDIFVSFSPERIDPGNARFDHEDVPRVLGGATLACRAAAAALLGRYAHNLHPVSSLEAAEMTKLLENTFRAVNIALANEFAEACLALDLPVVEIIEAAATKPYGFMPFYPGAGVGGHCIPCDPHYLLWQLRKQHINLPVIENAMSEIASRPRRVVERVRQTLADHSQSLFGARILVVGVSYKPDVADLRESPALEILRLLHNLGAQISYCDPYFETLVLHDGTELTGVKDPGASNHDLVLVHTNHTGFDWSWLAPETTVLDTTYKATAIPNRIVL